MKVLSIVDNSRNDDLFHLYMHTNSYTAEVEENVDWNNAIDLWEEVTVIQLSELKNMIAAQVYSFEATVVC
jgi:hypothetical protein